MACIERSHLTSRLFNSRHVRKTLALSRDVECCRAAATWEDSYYNLARLHESLRVPVQDVTGCKWRLHTSAIVALLADQVWTVIEPLTSIPLKC